MQYVCLEQTKVPLGVSMYKYYKPTNSKLPPCPLSSWTVLLVYITEDCSL